MIINDHLWAIARMDNGTTVEQAIRDVAGASGPNDFATVRLA